MWTQRIVGPILIGVIMLVGCAKTNYATYHFKSLNELADATGWDCLDMGDDEEKTKASLAEYGFGSLPCHDGAVVIYNSDARRAELDSLPQNALESGQCRLSGGNWAVVGSQFLVEDAEKKVGGVKFCA